MFLPQLYLERETAGRKEILNLIFKEIKQYWLGFSALKASDLATPLIHISYKQKSECLNLSTLFKVKQI